MGGPKALMLVGGRPWWQWQEERLAAAGVAGLWVVSREVDAALPAKIVRVTVAVEGGPMFASLFAGCKAMDWAGCIAILPVDVPVASASTWNRLRSEHTASARLKDLSHGFIATGPCYLGKHGHPVLLTQAALLKIRAADSATARLDTLLHNRTRWIDADDSDVCCNLNTPAEVTKWESRQNEVAR